MLAISNNFSHFHQFLANKYQKYQKLPENTPKYSKVHKSTQKYPKSIQKESICGIQMYSDICSGPFDNISSSLAQLNMEGEMELNKVSEKGSKPPRQRAREDLHQPRQQGKPGCTPTLGAEQAHQGAGAAQGRRHRLHPEPTRQHPPEVGPHRNDH